MHDPTQPRKLPLPEAPLSQRETIDLDATETPRPNRWHWLIDRNPLFLISGVLMLGGCYLVSSAIHAFDPAVVEERTLLLMLAALIVVLNVYEFAVIGLGLALSRTESLARDSRHLLGLALLLLVDASFVYNETSIFKPGAGGLIAAIAAGLALVKGCWIVRRLGVRLTRPAMMIIGLSLVMLYALPVVVRLIAHDGFLSQPSAILVWCGIGLAVALYALPLSWAKLEDSGSADQRQLQQLVLGGLIVMPLISLIAHACSLLWVYENAFALSMLSPTLLGLAMVMLRQHERLGGPAASAKAAAIVVACAIVPCLSPSPELTFESQSYTWLAFSPLRGTLLVSPLVLLWGWWIAGRSIFGGLSGMAPWALATAGHTPHAMLAHTRWLVNSTSGLLPRNQMQWGALAIFAAFVCLIVGGVISWLGMNRRRCKTP